ncbi:C-signal [Neosynchiropus ocellatus]
MSRLENFRACRSVLITGASRGIGLEMVRQLAMERFPPGKIIATARNPAGATKLLELAQKFSNVHVVGLDVVSDASIQECVGEVERLVQDDGLNCLINNAGINVDADLHSVTAEKMMENFHTNSVAPLMLTKALLPLLKRAASTGSGAAGRLGVHRAVVINVSSTLGSMTLNAGEMGKLIKWYPYRASKSALNMLTRSLAIDLDPDNILCMVMHPGWVRTDMGGPQGELSPAESACSVLSVAAGLAEKDQGSFLSPSGDTLPW